MSSFGIEMMEKFCYLKSTGIVETEIRAETEEAHETQRNQSVDEGPRMAEYCACASRQIEIVLDVKKTLSTVCRWRRPTGRGLGYGPVPPFASSVVEQSGAIVDSLDSIRIRICAHHFDIQKMIDLLYWLFLF